MKQVNIETIQRAEQFMHATPLSKAELTAAMDACIAQVRANMDYFKERFPFSCTKDLRYPIIDNIEWTDGFWTGMLWLSYEYTKEEQFKELALRNVDSFYHRIQHKIAVDHHDLGFLYSLSCVSAYRLLGDEKAKQAALMAADQLLTRWHEKGEFLQAWGPFDSKDHYRFIIDCMMNLPLLYWASETSGDPKYRDIANRHFATSSAYVIRDDASAFHTFYMNPENGAPDHGATHQGYRDDSAWARGQAWGIYGIPLNIRYTKDVSTKDLYRGMCNYFLNRLPQDLVCYWDLIFNDGSNQSRDSSAAAIAVCGMHEMDQYLSEDCVEKKVYQGAAQAILRSLIQNYAQNRAKPGDPILLHGVYSWHSGKGVDEGNIWGDYFYMEALMRSLKQWDPYW